LPPPPPLAVICILETADRAAAEDMFRSLREHGYDVESPASLSGPPVAGSAVPARLTGTPQDSSDAAPAL
jgi:hypothetical protein